MTTDWNVHSVIFKLLAVVASEDLAKSSAGASNNTGEPIAASLCTLCVAEQEVVGAGTIAPSLVLYIISPVLVM